MLAHNSPEACTWFFVDIMNSKYNLLGELLMMNLFRQSKSFSELVATFMRNYFVGMLVCSAK